MGLKRLSLRKIKKRLKLKRRVSSFKKNFKKKRVCFSIIFIVLGFLLMTPTITRLVNNYSFSLYLRNKQQYKSQEIVGPFLFSSNTLHADDVVSNFPNQVVIPSLKVDLKILPAKVINGVWEINENSVNFGIGSSLPFEKGNTVLFAHATKELFLPLKRIKKNDIISLKTADGRWFSYKVIEKKVIKPTEIDFLKPTSDKTLTLFTCTGFADLKRLIIIAKEQKT